MKFKIGDKVKILPSAVAIGIYESEVGTIQTILQIISSTTIVITASDGGCWHVDPEDITTAVVKGQQLLFDFMQQS